MKVIQTCAYVCVCMCVCVCVYIYVCVCIGPINTLSHLPPPSPHPNSYLYSLFLVIRMLVLLPSSLHFLSYASRIYTSFILLLIPILLLILYSLPRHLTIPHTQIDTLTPVLALTFTLTPTQTLILSHISNLTHTPTHTPTVTLPYPTPPSLPGKEKPCSCCSSTR